MSKIKSSARLMDTETSRGGRARSWEYRGRRYWQLLTDDAEVVAHAPWEYTLHYPPMNATFEVYVVRRGLSQFVGYAEGEHRVRLHACFGRAFAKTV